MSRRGREEAALGPLIEQLGPLNNQWRQARPRERVITLWDMGDAVLAHVRNPSDALLWEVHQKSYITRSMLRYALIVRRGWPERETLETLVRDLQSYSVFREALPFLKGDRENVDDATYRTVVRLLSGSDTHAATEYLRRLKGKTIGRKHKKGIAVQHLRADAVTFASALGDFETDAAQSTAPATDPEVLLALSQMAMALATGDDRKVTPAAPAKADGRLGTLARALTAAFAAGRAGIAAFRKIVGSERLMAAADLFNSMRSPEGLADWQRRRGSKFTMKR
jgi:hypothetical protein